jgi:GR25 family glycosyltransferase involved in LPS biosynthesis
LSYIKYKIAENLSDYEVASNVRLSPPVWGGEITANEYYKAIVSEYNRNLTILSPAELGCTLAHINIYNEVASNSSGALILESDMLLTPGTSSKSFNNVDFIHLADYSGQQFYGKPTTVSNLYHVNPHRNFWGTAAYFISSRTAACLLEFHKSSMRRADDWSYFFREFEINPYFSPIFEHDEEETTIGDQRTLRTVNGNISTMRISLRNIIQAVPRRMSNSTIVRMLAGERPIDRG